MPLSVLVNSTHQSKPSGRDPGTSSPLLSVRWNSRHETEDKSYVLWMGENAGFGWVKSHIKV